MPRSLYEQHNKCRHFNGIMNKACEAGVNYDEVRTVGGKRLSLPCFPEGSSLAAKAGEPKATCEKCSFKTHEELLAEVAEREADIERIMNVFSLVRPAILLHAGWDKKKPENKHGEIDCPACKTGKVRYSIAAYNGHVHAHCTTPNCASWME